VGSGESDAQMIVREFASVETVCAVE